ncbi:putative nucleoside diphosphatase [Xylona heveae TC161]|uniref:Putative nucleoside diphosphatase n=1 Tax=Xylona heveae (strain CBS 132557 / TC161) TaxID=1328760 RepID=A0A165H8R1_XYLHT|nr:putative nucleoside diphosphatase [Xylona heveae TC161]KZF23142.1 putative nucleoside diphosphatase [Xylona heveae TC161]
MATYWRYGVILDAGSSGTRVHVYRWKDRSKEITKLPEAEVNTLPALETSKKWTKKLRPGVSSFAAIPDSIGTNHLEPLIKHALKYIPKQSVESTPIYVLATAGMRLLPDTQRRKLLDNICSYIRTTTSFFLQDCAHHVQVISGETEGLYGWIAANYLLGAFDFPEHHTHGKGHHTYGFLDMGGASAQIAFAPNATEAKAHANDLKLLRLRKLNRQNSEYRVFVTTWLGFGVNEARRRYEDALIESTGRNDLKELPDPCLPLGLDLPPNTKEDHPGEKEHIRLVGTGRFDECLRQTYPLLDKDAPCEDHPCLLHGTHVPAIDFDVNHFVGISEYWHTTHEIFEMGVKEKSYDFHTYQQRVREFCSQDWKTISQGIKGKKWGGKVDEGAAAEVCFRASWLINMLHDGIGIPRVGIENTKLDGHNGTEEIIQHAKDMGFLDPFQAVNKIHETEVSWTMGKMLLYASSQISPLDASYLPVGFGSNVPEVPADFQYGGAVPGLGTPPDPIGSTDDDWSRVLFESDSHRRIPGFVLFALIVCIALFLSCGKDRRTRTVKAIRSGISWFWECSRNPSYLRAKLFNRNDRVTYERVLESGDANEDFELTSVPGLNTPSEPNEEHQVGKASGWASPRPGIDQGSGLSLLGDHGTKGLGQSSSWPETPSSAGIEKSLIVRTESRERIPSRNSVRLKNVPSALSLESRE